MLSFSYWFPRLKMTSLGCFVFIQCRTRQIFWLSCWPWFPLSGVRSTPWNISIASSLITNYNNTILKFFLKCLSQAAIESYPRFFESFPVTMFSSILRSWGSFKPDGKIGCAVAMLSCPLGAWMNISGTGDCFLYNITKVSHFTYLCISLLILHLLSNISHKFNVSLKFLIYCPHQAHQIEKVASAFHNLSK